MASHLNQTKTGKLDKSSTSLNHQAPSKATMPPISPPYVSDCETLHKLSVPIPLNYFSFTPKGNLETDKFEGVTFSEEKNVLIMVCPCGELAAFRRMHNEHDGAESNKDNSLITDFKGAAFIRLEIPNQNVWEEQLANAQEITKTQIDSPDQSTLNQKNTLKSLMETFSKEPSTNEFQILDDGSVTLHLAFLGGKGYLLSDIENLEDADKVILSKQMPLVVPFIDNTFEKLDHLGIEVSNIKISGHSLGAANAVRALDYISGKSSNIETTLLEPVGTGGQIAEYLLMIANADPKVKTLDAAQSRANEIGTGLLSNITSVTAVTPDYGRTQGLIARTFSMFIPKLQDAEKMPNSNNSPGKETASTISTSQYGIFKSMVRVFLPKGHKGSGKTISAAIGKEVFHLEAHDSKSNKYSTSLSSAVLLESNLAYTMHVLKGLWVSVTGSQLYKSGPLKPSEESASANQLLNPEVTHSGERGLSSFIRHVLSPLMKWKADHPKERIPFEQRTLAGAELLKQYGASEDQIVEHLIAQRVKRDDYSEKDLFFNITKSNDGCYYLKMETSLGSNTSHSHSVIDKLTTLTNIANKQYAINIDNFSTNELSMKTSELVNLVNFFNDKVLDSSNRIRYYDPPDQSHDTKTRRRLRYTRSE